MTWIFSILNFFYNGIVFVFKLLFECGGDLLDLIFELLDSN